MFKMEEIRNSQTPFDLFIVEMRLPVISKEENNEKGLAFDFVADNLLIQIKRYLRDMTKVLSQSILLKQMI